MSSSPNSAGQRAVLDTTNDLDPTTAIGQEEESEKARIERLGRQRPEKLDSAWKEFGFVFSVTMSQLLTEYWVSGFVVLVPTVTEALDIPASSATWPASAFSLVVSSFLLPFGRLADIYGGFPVYLAGCAWTAIWALIGGFSQNELMLDFCRAIQGLGPAAYLPASLTLLGSMYRPGPRKNAVFSIYGSMAPLGFFIGIFFAGVAGEYAGWRWYFYIGAILTFLTAVVAYLTIPSDYQERKNNGVKMDWLGSTAVVCGLILVVFAITQSAHASNGWATPYIPVTLILGVLILGGAFYIEGWVAEQPLLPFEVFKIKYMRPFILGLLFAYGTLGIFLLYATLYITNIMGASPMQVVAWIPGTILAIITCVAIIVDSLLFAIAPEGAGYWPWIFPAMICATLAIDLIFSVTNIFLSSTLPARQQGLAGGLANALLQLSIAILLGFSDIIAAMTSYQGEKQSYKNVFWFELACGAAALVIFVGFVRIDSAKSDLTADEKEALARETAAET
ncbi:hypothetical protein MBLNU13_g09493t1 [Cladosporium sp. NU13]